MDKQRLFFALWPDIETRKQFAELGVMIQGPSKGKLIPANNLHLTLMFLGDVSKTTLTKIEHFAEHITLERFALSIDQMEYQPKQGLIWLRPENNPPGLNQLADTLKTNLSALPVQQEKRQFLPHITLVRKSTVKNLPIEAISPIDWSVSDFVLVCSHQRRGGSQYEIIRRWNLL